ncbi:hypothetical protein NESM_000531500 [Novymonas esmeraldas]|uniref:CW-type domain-containing protein n=1 Tax=Novymonas esmeraldas TaxID=1808958 RepID=A0AAW0ER70_9TRYP
MEWPLAQTPFTDIVVEEEEDGGGGDVSSRGGGPSTTASRTPPQPIHQQQPRSRFSDALDRPESAAPSADAGAHESRGLRLTLRSSPAVATVATVATAVAPLRRTLQLRLTPASPDGAPAPPLPTPPPTPPPPSPPPPPGRSARKRVDPVTAAAAAATARPQRSGAAAVRPAPAPPAPPPPTTSTTTSASPEEVTAEARRIAALAARPASAALCLDWWMRLCHVDTHALFTSQPNTFEAPLRPLATASAAVFYYALTRCFEEWRRAHWESLVVLRGTGSAGVRRRGHRAAGPGTVRDPEMLAYANAVWYEALRVQRLMSQALLQSTDAEGGWTFEVGCRSAVLAAIGADAESAAAYQLCNSSSTAAPAASEALTAAVTVSLTAEATPAAPTSGRLTLRVPTAARVLSLLHVLDRLWAALPTSLPFRMPVSEMEAPGYYRSTRDPVSICQLYVETLNGMSAPAQRTCARQLTARARRVRDVLQQQPCDDGGGAAVSEEAAALFFSYADVRERLTTMKSNCDEYNGGGGELSELAAALLSLGVKILRDVQAAEDSHHAPTAQGGGADGATSVTPTWVVSPEELASTLFPPTAEAADVVPPHLRHPRSPAAAATVMTGAAAGGRHGRLLRLPSTAASVAADPPAAAAATAATPIWMQCCDCRAWHRLAAHSDCAPDTWTCRQLGLTCTPAASRRTVSKRAKTASAASQRAARQCDVDSSGGGGGGGDVDDLPLAAVLAAAAKLNTAAAAQTAAQRKRGRAEQRRRRSSTAAAAAEGDRARKKMRVAPTARSSSRSDSTCSSSDDSDSSSSSSSSTSSSSSGGSSSSSSTSSTATTPAPPPAQRTSKRATVATHALPRAAAVAAPTTASRASRAAAAALVHVAQAVAALEARPLHDDPFEQLEQVKQLEKQLSSAR